MNKKTDHKKPADTDKNQPWNKQFEDDRDDEGNLSRVATRKKSHGTKVLQYILWGLIALFIIVPVAYNAIASNSNNNNGKDKITVQSSSKSSSSASSKKPKKHKASSSEASSSVASSSAPAASQSSSAAVSSSVPASSSSSVASSSSSAASSSGAAQYYTVQQGDNAYRIAVNHGVSLSQFYQWNGQGTLTPGKSVRIK